MFNEIVINSTAYEKRVAILEDHKLVELFAEKKEHQHVLGNIYLGTVRDVLPGMGAAFLDVGLDRTAFIHYRDLEPKLLPEPPKKTRSKKKSSSIQDLLSPGQPLPVQIKKEPIGKKGARLTGKISLPGKFLVYIPFSKKVAISRKITTNAEKDRIKGIIKSIKEPNVGVIVRTEAEGIFEEDLVQEYNALAKTWNLISKQIKYAKPPICLFDENDLSFTLVRDLFRSDIDRLVIDDRKLYKQLVTHIKDISPELVERIELYKEKSPIFDAYGIEKEIESIFKSRISLPSGGNITIQQTEALVAIDVNTGSFTGTNNYKETILKTNIEAAYEAARQIRLRDLSGIMVIDFIDMTYEQHQEEVLNVLKNSLKRDRAKNKIYPFTPLGLVEISRKRTRASLLLSYSEQCPHCNGTGRMLSKDSMAVRISRWLKRAQFFIKNEPLIIVVSPNVKQYINENLQMFKDISNNIEFKGDKTYQPDHFKVYSAKTKKELTKQYNA